MSKPHPPKPRPVTKWWTCPECGDHNHPFDKRCKGCNTPRVRSVIEKGGSRAVPMLITAKEVD